MPAQPNILILMSDQHRADCLGIVGHPVVNTPNLDRLAAGGANFTHAYSASALCAPARRTLLSGQKTYRHGVLDENSRAPLLGAVLPELLAKRGFDTHLAGKLHLWPLRKYYGFATADWADWIDPHNDNDYTRFLHDAVGDKRWINGDHRFHQNSRRVCTWALDEELHFNHWCAESALRFINTRSANRPFFLMASFIPPHPPMFPLQRLLQKYLAQDALPPVVGQWAQKFAMPPADSNPIAWTGRMAPRALHLFRSAYFAAIEHVDQQVGRILDAIPPNTLTIYLSDHGDMLGDHYLYQKRVPYEQATRIPLIIRLPSEWSARSQANVEAPVELMDVFPTILDFLGLPVPDTVDGLSLLPLLRGDRFRREYIHGENARSPSLDSSMQFLSDGKWKFIWYPERNWQQLFQIASDPHELNDVIDQPKYRDVLITLQQRLVKELAGRTGRLASADQLLACAPLAR